MPKKTTEFQLDGLTCTSCEVILERELKKLPGVTDVSVSHRTGQAAIEHDAARPLRRDDVAAAVTAHGYGLADKKVSSSEQASSGTQAKSRWREIGGALVLVGAVALLLKATGVLNVDTTVGSSVGLGSAVVIGLVAATSTCAALVGGLLLSVTATLNQLRPNASGWERFRPHLYFNSGRLVSYFLLGGVAGWLGQAISISPRLTGVLTVLIAGAMILLAVDLLNLFPGSRWVPRLPKAWSHRLYGIAESGKPGAPLLLGALTFFLPCGFTQSMQLYALTTGSFWEGASVMLAFAVGTIPALLGIGVAASVGTQQWVKKFQKVAGAVVLVFGFTNLSAGFALTGLVLPDWSAGRESDAAAAARTGDVQVVEMAVNGIEYEPARVTLQAGVPVEWRIDGSGATGCTSSIVVPSLDIAESLSPSQETVIRFTPEKTGTIPFTCGMGMASGQFVVVDDAPGGNQPTTCDPRIQNCLES
jgi:sulfite exporter TauE/SafE/copper chaperone CopZ